MFTRLQNLLQKNYDSSPPPVRSFQVGQIFRGKVEKIFPNHTAIVQVGREKLVAHLQVGLTLGENYWFQVESLEGKPQLKVLQMNGESNPDDKTMIQNLLKEMNLPSSKNNIESVQFLLKEGMPLSKGMIKGVSGLLSQTNIDQNVLQTVKVMIQRNLPLTKEVLDSMGSIIRNESLQQLLTHLMNIVREQPNKPILEKLQELLKPMVQTEGEKVSENVIKQLLTQWLNPKGSNEAKIAFSLLNKLGILNETDERVALQQWLKNEQWIKNSRLDNKDNQVQLLKQLLYQQFSQKGMNDQPLFTRTFVQEDGTVTIQGQLNDGEQELLQKMVNKEMEDVQALGKGKETVILWKNLYDKIGFSYEKQLLEGKFTDEKLNVLKTVLLQIMKEDLPQGIKEASQSLLNRIIGLQLVSTESTNVLQHYCMQIPISFWNKQTDLTIQWQGKKREDGKIDPNYCRVLFYLDMDVLQETIVDMQVQNRIVRITVYNDTDGVQGMGKIYEKDLREKLQNLGYRLSTIYFSKIGNQERPMEKISDINVFPSDPYSGVDIRI